MKTRIQKWGNSLALRIPKSFAAEAHIKKDSLVDVSFDEGKLVVIPVSESEITLKKLLDGVTEQNIHREVETGGSMGDEVW